MPQPTPIKAVREVVRGATFAVSGLLSFPTGAWTPSVVVYADDGPAPYASGIQATMVAVGPNADAPGETEYLVSLFASSAATSKWPVRGLKDEFVMEGRLWLADGAGNAKPTDNRFTLKVTL